MARLPPPPTVVLVLVGVLALQLAPLAAPLPGTAGAAPAGAAPAGDPACPARLDNPAPSLLLYPRVPKTGSSTLLRLFKDASTLGNSSFHVDGFRRPVHAHLSRPELAELASSLLQQLPRPAFYDRHVRFSTILVADPHTAAIGMVREPEARFVSSYYYTTRRRFPTLDQCLEALALEQHQSAHVDGRRGIDTRPCRPRNTMTRYFCGHDAAVCDTDGDMALQRAIANIEHSFAVVLVLEHLPLSLQLLGHVLPSFAAGMAERYAAQPRRENTSPLSSLPAPGPAALAAIRRRNNLDARLYQFCLARLLAQARACGLSPAQ